MCEMIDRMGPLFHPYMKKLIKKYVKFINKIIIFTINKMQNKSFARGFQICHQKCSVLIIHIQRYKGLKSKYSENF